MKLIDWQPTLATKSDVCTIRLKVKMNAADIPGRNFTCGELVSGIR